MFLSRKMWLSAVGTVCAVVLGVADVRTAEAAPPPSRGYEFQKSRSSPSTSSYSRPTTVSPAPATIPGSVTVTRPPAYPYGVPSAVVRSGPTIVPPVTAPSAPATTGDATAPAASRPASVVVWYEYVPSLGGWIEFRGTPVAGPPSQRR